MRALTKLWLCALLAAASGILHAQPYTLSGLVRDSVTRSPLPGAVIRIVGTNAGAIANSKGIYRLPLAKGTYTITVAYLGYKQYSTSMMVDASKTLDFSLTPSPVQLGSTTVYAKNAEAIIRQAIAEKQRTMAALQTYSFDAYSKTTILASKGTGAGAAPGGVSISIGTSDTTVRGESLSVITVLEAYSSGFWQKNKGLRETVKQRRQTANFPENVNFNAVLAILNFNDDEQRLGKYHLTGPTSPDALDAYSYELLDVTTLSGRKVYRLRMTPKKEASALWEGIVAIADSTWNVVEVDLRPNDVVNFPIIDSLRFTQEFHQIDSIYWMPVNIVTTANLSVKALLINAAIRFEHSSVLSNFTINPIVPDSVLEQPRVVIDSAATKFDSAYWRAHEVMPLTPEEQTAYTEIDSIMKADSGKSGDLLGGILGAPFVLFRPPFTGFSDIYHFDRAEGHALGLGLQVPWQTWLPQTTLIGKFSYGFSDKRTKWEIDFSQTVLSSPTKSAGVFLAAYRSLQHRPDADFYTRGEITLAALMEKIDYRDYYYGNGWRAGVAFRAPTRSLELSYVAEDQRSATRRSNFSLLFPSHDYRLNPRIMEGMLRVARAKLTFGPSDAITEPETEIGGQLDVEYARRSVLGGDFDYTRTQLVVLTHLRTSSFGFFDARTTLGIIGATAPPQRLFAVESEMGGIAPFGAMRALSMQEFIGDRFISIAAQQNLGDGFFRLTRIPFLRNSGIELMLDAGAVWCDASDTARASSPVYLETAKLPYLEGGFGLNRILAILRLDFAWRLTHRHDSGNFQVTLTAAGF